MRWLDGITDSMNMSFEQALGAGGGQGSLVCCSPWCCKIKSDWATKLKMQLGCKSESLSHLWLFVTPWTVAPQAPLSMEFSRQEYWSGLPFPSPGDLLDPEIEPRFPTFQADSLLTEPPGQSVGRGLNKGSMTFHRLNPCQERRGDLLHAGICYYWRVWGLPLLVSQLYWYFYSLNVYTIKPRLWLDQLLWSIL